MAFTEEAGSGRAPEYIATHRMIMIFVGPRSFLIKPKDIRTTPVPSEFTYIFVVAHILAAAFSTSKEVLDQCGKGAWQGIEVLHLNGVVFGLVNGIWQNAMFISVSFLLGKNWTLKHSIVSGAFVNTRTHAHPSPLLLLVGHLQRWPPSPQMSGIETHILFY